eukprot:scaffold16871_cov118-Isochrysis_galbana.AAC.3
MYAYSRNVIRACDPPTDRLARTVAEYKYKCNDKDDVQYSVLTEGFDIQDARDADPVRGIHERLDKVENLDLCMQVA